MRLQRPGVAHASAALPAAHRMTTLHRVRVRRSKSGLAAFLLVVLVFILAACGGGGGGSGLPGTSRSMPGPTTDPRLALAIGIADGPIDYSNSAELTSARAPPTPYGPRPDQYDYEQTVRYEIDGDSYETDRASAAPKLPAPCSGSNPSGPCAETLSNGNYEIELRFSGLFKVAEMHSVHNHGTNVAEAALEAATDLGPSANYLIRSLPVSGGLSIFTLLQDERATFNRLSFPQFSSPSDAVPLIQALRTLFDTARARMTNVSEHVAQPDFVLPPSTFGRLAQAGLRIFNHSHIPFRFDPNDYARSVGFGAVHIWAAGNGHGSGPNYQAGFPHLEPNRNLERGWLAVVALNENGTIANYSSICRGTAVDAGNWCLAAPGIHNGNAGTSFSAPYVAGGIAALKARFPSLSHQQIRARILETANSTGIYADSTVYGRGRFDYSAASGPVGPLLLPHGRSTIGPASLLAGSSLRLARGLSARHLAGRRALVLDSYDRASFPIDLGSLAGDRPGPGMAELDDAVPLEVTGVRHRAERPLATLASGRGHAAYAFGGSGATFGLGRGTGALDSLGAALAGADLPALGRYRLSSDALAAGVALPYGPFGSRLVARMAVEPSEARREPASGVAGQAPGTVFAGSFHSPSDDSAFGLSFASDLASPAGISGAGAFAVSGTTFDMGYAQRLATDGPWSLTGRGRVSKISFDDTPLVSADRAFVAGVGVEGGYGLGERLTLAARFEAEKEYGGGQVKVHLASSVDETGTLTLSPVGLPHSDSLDRQKASLVLRYRTPRASWSVGGLVERDAFGKTAAVVGTRGSFRF